MSDYRKTKVVKVFCKIQATLFVVLLFISASPAIAIGNLDSENYTIQYVAHQSFLESSDGAVSDLTVLKIWSESAGNCAIPSSFKFFSSQFRLDSVSWDSNAGYLALSLKRIAPYDEQDNPPISFYLSAEVLRCLTQVELNLIQSYSEVFSSQLKEEMHTSGSKFTTNLHKGVALKSDYLLFTAPFGINVASVTEFIYRIKPNYNTIRASSTIAPKPSPVPSSAPTPTPTPSILNSDAVSKKMKIDSKVILCVKGKAVLKLLGKNSKCPKGYRKK